MSVTVVPCPDCGEWLEGRTGVDASAAWAAHYAAIHTEEDAHA